MDFLEKKEANVEFVCIPEAIPYKNQSDDVLNFFFLIGQIRLVII